MITVPSLDPCTDFLDTDVVMITHSNSTTEKITGANLKTKVLDSISGLTAVTSIDDTDIVYLKKSDSTLKKITGQNLKKAVAVDQVKESEMNPVTGNAVAQILKALPTDAVLHYSFDDVPDYPDGSADVRLLNNNTYDIQSTNCKLLNNGGTTFSNTNGNIQVDITGGGSNGASISNTYVSGKIVKMKIKIISIQGTLVVHNGFGNYIYSFIRPGEYTISYLHQKSNIS